MTREDRIKKLQCLITCMKCEVSGKSCDDNCPTQYDAGNMGEIIENLEEIAKALEQQPCEDAVSREAVEDIVMWYDGQGEMLDEIQKLQSVQTKPKTGHWEWVQYDYNPKLGNWHCSECRCVVVECVDKNEKGGIPLYKYCPQCGARMVEPSESEDAK